MALLDYCLKLNNFFINDYDEDIHTGDYTIKNGAIDLDFISKNQYFRIVGSKFNDGIYRYSDDLELIDEEFNGGIWSMNIPKHFIEITKKADKYLSEHPQNNFQSESFGGYSYNKGSFSDSFNYLPQDISDNLKQYRKKRVF